MARVTQTVLIDDLDGSDADETFTFEFDGRSYEIDLTTKHAEQMERAFQLLDPFVDHLRRLPSSGRSRRTTRPRKAAAKKAGKSKGSNVDAKAIRVWAWENGIELSNKGRVPVSIVEKWRTSAGNR